MPKGRCAGCGLENSSAKLIERHMTKCPEYLDLYKTDAAKALSAEAEAQRYDTLKKTDEFIEAKEAEKDARYDGYREAAARKIEALRDRWRGGQKFKQVNRKSTPVASPENGRAWNKSAEDLLAEATAKGDLAGIVAAERLAGLTGVEA